MTRNLEGSCRATASGNGELRRAAAALPPPPQMFGCLRDIPHPPGPPVTTNATHARFRFKLTSFPVSVSVSVNKQTEGNSDTPPDVSWEELRSTHIKSKARVRKSYALPSYGDVVRAENDLNDDHSRPPPPCYSPHDADNALRLSIGIPDFPGPGSFRAIKSARIARPNAVSDARRGARTPGGLSSKTFDRNLSPGTRAVNARRAARNAQLSAEKALAAAAMASRAADLAAQAALEVRFFFSLCRAFACPPERAVRAFVFVVSSCRYSREDEDRVSYHTSGKSWETVQNSLYLSLRASAVFVRGAYVVPVRLPRLSYSRSGRAGEIIGWALT